VPDNHRLVVKGTEHLERLVPMAQPLALALNQLASIKPGAIQDVKVLILQK
jgi:hypothetical protein